MTELQEFFQKHINHIKKNKVRCQECGAPLKGSHDEVAHILNKSTYKSLATEDYNILYLCGVHTKNQCHGKLDNSSADIIHSMKIFDIISNRFDKLEQMATEKIPFITIEKYTKTDE